MDRSVTYLVEIDPTRLRNHELLPKYFKQPKYDEKQAEAEDKPG